MNSNNLDILNAFIHAPILKHTSAEFPYDDFDFRGESLAESDFQFPHNSIMGMQAEACFKAYLEQSNFYDLLVFNLQIYGKSPHSTLGELDYIVKDLETHKNIHIELACKFFLFDNQISGQEEEKWIGSNRKDSLAEKWDKIRSRQFPMLQTVEAVQKLKSLKIKIPTEQQVCFKAFLFIPKYLDKFSFSNNYRECIVGYWINQKDLDNEYAPEVQYAIPTKKEWLLPLNYITSWVSYLEIKPEIAHHLKNKKSPLVYKKTRKGIERFFVVWW